MCLTNFVRISSDVTLCLLNAHSVLLPFQCPAYKADNSQTQPNIPLTQENLPTKRNKEWPLTFSYSHVTTWKWQSPWKVFSRLYTHSASQPPTEARDCQQNGGHILGGFAHPSTGFLPRVSPCHHVCGGIWCGCFSPILTPYYTQLLLCHVQRIFLNWYKLLWTSWYCEPLSLPHQQPQAMKCLDMSVSTRNNYYLTVSCEHYMIENDRIQTILTKINNARSMQLLVVLSYYY